MSWTLLEQEIYEQPAILQRLVERQSARAGQIAAALRGQFDYVIIAARGISDNAARYAQYLLGQHNRLPVMLATPSLFTLYRRPPLMKRALVMGISQSGKSPDIVSVIEEGNYQGCPTLAITNDPASPLAEAAAHLIDISAGHERSIAATKTYTATLVALMLFSGHLIQEQAVLGWLSRLPDLAQQTLEAASDSRARMERYAHMQHCAVIGRGFNYATAFEIALKITELTRIVADPYSSADFLHGPVAMVGDGFPMILVAPSGAVLGDMRRLVADLLERRADLLLISNDADLLQQARGGICLPPDCPEWLLPAIAVMPGQMLGLALALARGIDPGRPAGLTKVTETW